MRTLEQRFLAKISVGDDCWEWLAAQDQNGYGFFGVGRSMRRAHRVSYELFVGPIPDGLCVCHHCDNKPCVRPSHLFLGTNDDNVADRDAKGRQARGEGIKQGKLTLTIVSAIRTAHSTGQYTYAELGRTHGVTPANIRALVRGTIWKERG